MRRILQRLDEPGGGTYVANEQDRGQSIIDLRTVAGVDLDFFFYYSMDIGGGSHKHDVEFIDTRLGVTRRPACEECPFVMGLLRVNGKAHGIQWYDNTLEVDASAVLPIHIFVEEGKHASCTDRNADGYFTPGYDVTERVNDAWRVVPGDGPPRPAGWRGRLANAIWQVVKDKLKAILKGSGDIDWDMSNPLSPLKLAESGPTVILVCGVNGVGKTTSIAKLANFLQKSGSAAGTGSSAPSTRRWRKHDH